MHYFAISEQLEGCILELAKKFNLPKDWYNYRIGYYQIVKQAFRYHLYIQFVKSGLRRQDVTRFLAENHSTTLNMIEKYEDYVVMEERYKVIDDIMKDFVIELIEKYNIINFSRSLK